MRSTTLALIAMVHLAITAAADPSQLPIESESSSWPQLGDHVTERLKVRGAFSPGIIIRNPDGSLAPNQPQPKLMVYLELNPAPQPIRARDAVQHGVLSYVAQMYALSTGDFDVCLGDLIETGFLPYMDVRDIHTGQPLDSSRGIDTEGTRRLLSTYDVYLAGSPLWLAHVKSSTLSSWISESLTPNEEESSWLRNPAFWINPFSGAATKAGPDPGDYSFNKRTWSGGTPITTNADGPGPGCYPVLRGASREQYAAAAGGQTITLNSPTS